MIDAEQNLRHAAPGVWDQAMGSGCGFETAGRDPVAHGRIATAQPRGKSGTVDSKDRNGTGRLFSQRGGRGCAGHLPLAAPPIRERSSRRVVESVRNTPSM